MSVVRLYVPRDDGGGIDAFVQCYVMAVLDVSWGRFGLVFSVLVGAVLVCVGRFRPSLGPFWRWAVLVGSPFYGVF